MRTIDATGQARRQLAFELKSIKRHRQVRKVRNGALRIMSIKQAIEKFVEVDYVHVLIDYRNDNKVIKNKVMSLNDAAIKNNSLRGTGFAWAKVDGSVK